MIPVTLRLKSERTLSCTISVLPYTRKFSLGENFRQFCLQALLAKKFFREYFHTVKFLMNVGINHACMDIARTCASAAHCASPTTSWRVARLFGEIKFGKIFVTTQSMSHW